MCHRRLSDHGDLRHGKSPRPLPSCWPSGSLLPRTCGGRVPPPIVSGRHDMSSPPSDDALAQLRLRYRLMAQTTDTYAAEGMTAVAQDVIIGPILSDVIAMIRTRPLAVVVLAPSVDVIRRREAGRSKSGYRGFTPDELDNAACETFASDCGSTHRRNRRRKRWTRSLSGLTRKLWSSPHDRSEVLTISSCLPVTVRAMRSTARRSAVSLRSSRSLRWPAPRFRPNHHNPAVLRRRCRACRKLRPTSRTPRSGVDPSLLSLDVYPPPDA